LDERTHVTYRSCYYDLFWHDLIYKFC
jgi:hypothetical protein